MKLALAMDWPEAAALFTGALMLALAWQGLRRAVSRFRRGRWARDKRSMADLAALSPNEFEAITAAAFEAKGWRVEIIGRQGQADGGLDLMLYKGGRRIVAQCKRYAAKVGAPTVRETMGVMMHHRAHGAYVVALSGFTRQAREWAKGKPLRLIDGQQLLGAIHAKQSRGRP
jgi:restriction system protein